MVFWWAFGDRHTNIRLFSDWTNRITLDCTRWVSAATELNKPLSAHNVTELNGSTRSHWPYGSEFIYLHGNCIAQLNNAICATWVPVCVCARVCSRPTKNVLPPDAIFLRFILTSFLRRCLLLVFALAARTNPINTLVTPPTVTRSHRNWPRSAGQQLRRVFLWAFEMSGKRAVCPVLLFVPHHNFLHSIDVCMCVCVKNSLGLIDQHNYVDDLFGSQCVFFLSSDISELNVRSTLANIYPRSF